MVNLVGAQFSDLTVIAPDYTSGHRKWLCRCTCGMLVVSSVGALNSRSNVSCSGERGCSLSVGFRRRGLAIMVVDDDLDLCETLATVLRESGKVVSCCSSALEALSLVATGDFNVILTDLMMPCMDGIELCKRVLAVKPNTSIVMMTGYASVDVTVDSVRAGACDFITKPISIEELTQVIDRVQCKTDRPKPPPRRRMTHDTDVELRPSV